MSNKNKKTNDNGGQNNSSHAIPVKHSTQRRRLLKNLASGAGAATVAQSLPEDWTRPVVDSVLLPAHATATGGITLAAQITYSDSSFDPGTYNGISGSEATRTYTVFVDPPQAIPVTLVVTGIEADRGDTDTGVDGDAVRTVSGVTDPAGTFSFTSNDQDDTPDLNDDTLALVASSPGLSSSNVTINWI